MKEKSKSTQYKCSQIFGFKGVNEKVHEEDIVSVLKFDQTGHHVCLGDKAGRIIIFKLNDSKRKEEKYQYYTQFQAYNREFDPLNSIEVDEEINDISWMKPQGNYLKLLTMNCKNVKLWKIHQKPEKKFIKSAGKQLTIPKLHKAQNSINATLQQKYKIQRKTFPNKHQEELLSVCHSQNQQYFLSSDSLQTLLWSFQKPTMPYIIADFKKDKKVQEIKQGINCVRFHPRSDNMFAYGTNRGSLFLSDMRISNSNKSTTFKIQTIGKKNFFTQMISSYSSLDFLSNNKYIVCRDFLTVKIWDICKTNKPIACVTVQDSLKTKLCQIFENDSIFDKFQVSASNDSNTILTGNYNNNFHLIDVNQLQNTQYEINYKKQSVTRSMIPGKNSHLSKMDYFRKTIACDFHPKKNTLAIASLNCFFTYTM